MVNHSSKSLRTFSVILLCLLTAGSLITDILARTQEARSEMLKSAWRALNNARNKDAIEITTTCVDAYRDEADIKQEDLMSQGVPLPPTGTMEPETARRVLSRGLLNDTAACFFILGEALSRVDRPKDACEAFGHLRNYAHARIYDPPKDSFWDPSSVARARIRKLDREIGCD